MISLSTLVGALALSGAATTTTPPDGASKLDDSAPLAKYTNIVLPTDATVTVFGRIQADGTWATGDPPFDTRDGAEFRRARVGAKGDVGAFGYHAEYDFAGSEVDFADVYLDWADSPLGKAQVGHFKEPVSLEELTSSRFTTFIERSLPTVFAPSRNTGIMFSDHADRLAWQYGVFRTGSNAQGRDQGEGDYAITGRLAGTVLQDDHNVVHLGISASNRSEAVTSYSQRPEAHLLNKVVSTGAINNPDSVRLYGLEAAWVGGPWSVQSEYLASDVNNSSGPDATYSGYYVEGSYYLTGEMRNYKASSGKFDRPPVNEEFDGKGGLGAVQLAARYSMLDLNDGPSTDELKDSTLGVNWWLNDHTRLSANYVHSKYTDSGNETADILVVRFQVDF